MLYELTMIFRSSLGEEDRKKVLETVKKLIGKSSRLVETLDLGKRMLAYPIKKEKEGNFICLKLEITGQEAVEINKKLKNDEKVLRYLLVKAAKVSKSKTAIHKRERR